MAEGYKDWAAGDVLTAADLEDYTVKQSVMRFASAAARDSALTSVLTEGMVAYLKDVDQIMMYSGSAWENVEQVGAWRSWTPTLTASVTNPTLGTGSAAEGFYMKIGRTVIAQFAILFGSSGVNAGSGVYRIDLPVVATQRFTGIGWHNVGDVRLVDFGSGEARASIGLNSTGLITMTYPAAWPTGAATSVGAAAPWTWAATDQMHGRLIYEAAS